jgi:hypothetical protein
MNHAHTCPKCFEHFGCTDDCTIEPDLDVTKAGLSRGAHVECNKCQSVWTLVDALEFVRSLEIEVVRTGYHVGLRGSVIMRGRSENDLDVIIYPHDSTKCDYDYLVTALHAAGLRRIADVNHVHAHWRRKGSTDEKHVEIWSYGEHLKVDILFV